MPIIISTKNNRFIQQSVEVLLDGGVIILPTETVYGLVCDAVNSAAIDRISLIKRRDTGKKLYTVFVKDIAMARRLAVISDPIEKLMQAYSPGPLTYVLPAHEGATIAVRVPDHKAVLQILESCNAPLIGTSVNLSGEPAASSVDGISKEILDAVDLVLDDGPCPLSQASTVVDLTQTPPVIVREGPITYDEIMRCLKG